MTYVGRVLASRYEISRELAAGAAGQVYLGHDRLLERQIAVKILHPEDARESSFVERFRREAQAAANLNNASIVGIYDWGQDAGTYFIVMEYVAGQSLRDVIRRDAPLDARRAAEIAAEVAGALAYAHRAHVVHRALNPGSVLLTDRGVVKVVGFGFGLVSASARRPRRTVIGTTNYMSPEQTQGLALDGRADVYSLGVVLYEMVTGVLPFSGESPVAVAHKHVREAPAPPTQRNPDLPADLDAIILTAMAKLPANRYQTADDLRADLLQFGRGRPIAVAPVKALATEGPSVGAKAPGGHAQPAGRRHVFVSYSRTDRKYVDRLVAAFKKRKIPFWIDHEIDYGARWPVVIQQQLLASSVVVVVMSPQAEASVWVEREIAEAERTGHPILPLLLAGDRFFRLAEVQYEDVRSERMPTSRWFDRVNAFTSRGPRT